MPRLKLKRNYNEPSLLHPRPQRSMKVRKVFDPSDTHVPKRRKKRKLLSKQIKLECVSDSSRSESELIEISSCILCSTEVLSETLIECPICLTTVHRKCLINDEPLWKHKLSECGWCCKNCRKNYCSKCFETESNLELYRCYSCNVGIHAGCYDLDDNFPLNPSSSGKYMCDSCKIVASNTTPDVEEKYISERFTVLKNTLTNVNDFEQEWYVPDITGWTKTQIYQYLKKRKLPKEVTDVVIEKKLTGKVVKRLERQQIVSDFGLKLGPALKLYKEVRILQTRNTSCKVYWEDTSHLNDSD